MFSKYDFFILYINTTLCRTSPHSIKDKLFDFIEWIFTREDLFSFLQWQAWFSFLKAKVTIYGHVKKVCEYLMYQLDYIFIRFNTKRCRKNLDKMLGPVVQSVVSLTSSLNVISLTVLADSIYNILILFAEKMWVAFALQKLLTFFSAKNSSIFVYHSI